MYVHVHKGNVVVGVKVSLECFPSLLRAHMRKFTNTMEIEESGWLLSKSDFRKEDISKFIKDVCLWGRYAGVAGRVIKRNELGLIRSAFRGALSHLESAQPCLASALKEVNRVKALGKVSFASKHLRFLKPEICPVYDSVLANAFPYPFTPHGYAQFSADCLCIANALREAGIDNPNNRESGAWYCSDVEAALYAHVKGA